MALCRARHELWIILKIIDYGADSASRRVNRADSLELFERRTWMRAAVNLNIFVANGQFPVAVLTSRLVSSEDGWTTSEKKRHQKGEEPLGHRR